MTSAEALAELRRLLAFAVRHAATDTDRNEIRGMLWTAREIRDGGTNPLIELRLRRWRRRAVARAAYPP